VGRDYLDAIAASFSDDSIGAITCLYGGVPVDELFARLAAMHSEEEFAPSVLVAQTVTGKLWFCLGATMAVRSDVLRDIGGIEALGSNLADDYELGKLVWERGLRVELSRYVVHTTVAHTDFSQLWAHELRWSRTNFRLTPAGHVFSFLMYTLPFAVAYALIARTPLALGLLVLVAALRLGVHVCARSMFGNTQRDEQWLIPLRDLISLAVWAASLVTRNVRWRGNRHRM
jgi:ceramide glucosyltransferase